MSRRPGHRTVISTLLAGMTTWLLSTVIYLVLRLARVWQSEQSDPVAATLAFAKDIGAIMAGCTACGFMVVWLLVRFAPSRLTVRRWYLWPFVVGIAAAGGMYLWPETILGRWLASWIPPAHFGMSGLFVGAILVGIVLAAISKLLDVGIRTRELRREVAA